MKYKITHNNALQPTPKAAQLGSDVRPGMKLKLFFIVGMLALASETNGAPLISSEIRAEPVESAWLEIRDDGECPDALQLRRTSYVVFNDCLGVDPLEPVIEVGRFKAIDGRFEFSARVVAEMSFLGPGSEVVAKILERTPETLVLRIGATPTHFQALKELPRPSH